ncbi:MAG: DUF3575 domain-containing protein [Rikenellaceae bacterium]
MKRRVPLITILFILIHICSYAQRAVVSTDVLKWTVATPNINVDVLLTDRFTAAIELSANPFEKMYGELYTKHLSISPEVKYWFKRPIYSHYLGANFLYSMFNVGYKDYRECGDIVALGITYGYSIYLNQRWSLTPSVGGGVGFLNSGSVEDGQYQPTQRSIKPVVTKLGISISYLID